MNARRFARGIKVACNKSNEGDLPDCTCHYPQCQKEGFFCFLASGVAAFRAGYEAMDETIRTATRSQ